VSTGSQQVSTATTCRELLQRRVAALAAVRRHGAGLLAALSVICQVDAEGAPRHPDRGEPAG
jgi:hypothetical protein